LKQEHGWSDGDEVITTPLTFVSTNHAILYENLTPVFADIDESLNLNPDFIKEKITPKTKAIIFVGVGGNTANLLDVVDLAKKHNLKIILDAAHMSGSRINGRHVGFDVDVSVFSFQAVKNLPTADSGMICFADENLDKKARELAWLGINKDTFERSKQGTYKWDYNVNEVGYKYHGNSIMASLALVGLKYLDDDNAYRRQLSQWYIQNLGNKVKLINHESNETSRHLFQVLVNDREKVIEYLTQYDIYPGVHYRDNTEYAPFHGTHCKNAQEYSQRVLSMPLHLWLTKKDIDYISKVLLEAIASVDR
jgi:dTDP-4-amino-4,6-dideoxygalactose transaminase